jgi:hypothetical protein
MMADALKKLNEHILRIGAETARLQSSSGEYLWVCCRERPPLLADPEPQKGETNPLRRQNGQPNDLRAKAEKSSGLC